MPSSCRADTGNQDKLTDGNNGIAPLVNPPITVRQMCKRAPHAFQVNWPNSKPSQTLEQWAAL
jgi:hypothetical protein